MPWGQLNPLWLSGLSSRVSGLADLGWGTGNCILKMTYSDFDIGNTWNHAVRKAADSLFLKWMDADPTLLTGCFLFNSHNASPRPVLTATCAENPSPTSEAKKRQKITWSWIQVSSATLHQAATKKTHWPTAILLLASTEICSKPLQMKPSCLSSIPDVFYNVWLW